MGAYERCQFCGQTRLNGQECFTHGDMRDCSFLKVQTVQCAYKGGCVHGKGDPPMDCDAPNCLKVVPK